MNARPFILWLYIYVYRTAAIFVVSWRGAWPARLPIFECKIVFICFVSLDVEIR